MYILQGKHKQALVDLSKCLEINGSNRIAANMYNKILERQNQNTINYGSVELELKQKGSGNNNDLIFE